MNLTDPKELANLYSEPSERALKKVLHALDKHSKNFISKSPFLVLSTASKDLSMDTSPRGGRNGFVHVQDDQTIIIPDAKGNNRTDSIRNIIETGKVGLLFMLPGIDETLRINGSATISIDPKIIGLFPHERFSPKVCIVIKVSEVYMHCAKALMRSKLWDSTNHIERADFPTMGQILKDQLNSPAPPETHEDMVSRYSKDL